MSYRERFPKKYFNIYINRKFILIFRENFWKNWACPRRAYQPRHCLLTLLLHVFFNDNITFGMIYIIGIDLKKKTWFLNESFKNTVVTVEIDIYLFFSRMSYAYEIK